MADSRTYNLLNGVTVEKLGEHLIAWFQQTKNMEANGGPAQGGYFVQAKDSADGWKKISGMTKAIQIQLLKGENTVVVNCGFGNWSDKVGAGVVGMFLFAPLAVTAAIGAVSQNKLPNEVFNEIERYIMMGGNSTIATIGSRVGDNEVVCPRCKTKNPQGQNFCKQCGAKLGRTCPKCGNSIDSDSKFCPHCGSSIADSTVCISCGANLMAGASFCSVCGAKQENA